MSTYTGLYKYHDKQIKGAQKDLVLNEECMLPEWVAYGQNSSSPFWTKRIVGRNLLYEVHTDEWWSFDFNRGSFSEIRKHDPLVATAALLTDKLQLSNKEQVQVLSANANTRHYAYEKLWSGKNLKVTNAYKTIVGKEMRDPVVLHWQEGNRLTFTIFPCTPKEARRVKIGITAPLKLKSNKLVFESMQIQGPDNTDAEELIHIKILGKSTDEKLPRSFKEELPKQYIYEGKALDHWTCSFQAETLANKSFSFNGKS